MGLREQQTNQRRERILEAARRLIRKTGGTSSSMRARDVEHRPRFIAQSLHRWMRTAQAVVRQGLLPDSIDTALLARPLMINFIGVLDLWIHEELDDDGFRAQSLYGFTLLVLANAPA